MFIISSVNDNNMTMVKHSGARTRIPLGPRHVRVASRLVDWLLVGIHGVGKVYFPRPPKQSAPKVPPPKVPPKWVDDNWGDVERLITIVMLSCTTNLSTHLRMFNIVMGNWHV